MALCRETQQQKDHSSSEAPAPPPGRGPRQRGAAPRCKPERALGLVPTELPPGELPFTLGLQVSESQWGAHG